MYMRSAPAPAPAISVSAPALSMLAFDTADKSNNKINTHTYIHTCVNVSLSELAESQVSTYTSLGRSDAAMVISVVSLYLEADTNHMCYHY